MAKKNACTCSNRSPPTWKCCRHQKRQLWIAGTFLLKSLGSSPKLVFDPPVEINCRMMAALYRWNKTTLQPAARNKLGSPVVRIVGASGYSCRNVYFLPEGNLSQHAFANAIDIAAFELKDGRSITVLKGWGPTARDIKAQAKEKSKQRT